MGRLENLWESATIALSKRNYLRGSRMSFTPFTLDHFTHNIYEALRAWRTVGGTPENLLESLQLVQLKRTTERDTGLLSQNRLITNGILLAGLEALEAHDQMGAEVLQLRFPENNKIMSVAYQLNVSEHTVSRLQKSAIGRLARLIYDQEMELREKMAQEREVNLPPKSYTTLFGTDDAQAELKARLLDAHSPWVVALVGIGGIGKTSLADAVTRQVIREFVFDDVIWLRIMPQTMDGRSHSPDHAYTTIISEIAQQLWPQAFRDISPQQQLIRVRQTLKERPFLIIIDNIETDTAHLLAHLGDLADPSKILLTSRVRPTKLAGVFNFSLDELSYADAADFIRHQARETGIYALESADDEDITAVFNMTGGNPLALKLVVSLLDILPLSQILTALSKGQAGDVENLYKYIYWQTWQTLTSEMQALLQSMPLVSGAGATADYLQEISGLSAGQLWPAIQELRKRSLLEVRGDINEKRYGIHRLTETFLRTEIIHWPE